MLEVAKKLDDQQFFLRMNNIPNAKDAVANDVKYHITCWVSAQRKVATPSFEGQELDDLQRVLADIEIVNTVSEIIHESEIILDMNSINTTYNNLLENEDQKQCNYKRYLKTLLEENVADIVFSRPKARNQPEMICSSTACTKAINETFQNTSDDFNVIFQAAKIIRNKLLNSKKWLFEGTYDGFSIPQELKSLLHWIITGPKNTRRLLKLIIQLVSLVK